MSEYGMTYAETHMVLNAPCNKGRDFVVDMNEGRFVLTHEEALAAWEEITPGEPFDIIRVGSYK